jgi:hypothetical protein
MQTNLYTTFKKIGVVTPEEVPTGMTNALIDHGYTPADPEKSPRILFAELSVLANTAGSEAEFTARLEEAALLASSDTGKSSPSQDGCIVKEGVCVP